MKTFITIDENNKVTSVLYSETLQEGFLQLNSPIPQNDDTSLTLFYNRSTRECFFSEDQNAEKTALELIVQENEELKSRLSTLEDTIMVLTMF